MTSDEWNLLQRFTTTADEGAFAQLVQEYGPLVLGVCRRRLHDAHLAEDACQAAFLVLARRAKQLNAQASLANWLFGVALRTSTHVAATHKAAQQRQLEIARQRQEAHMDKGNEPELQCLEEVLDDALARLPRTLREPLLLSVLGGKSYDQIGAELRLSADTVRGRIARARERLRRRLAPLGVALLLPVPGQPLGAVSLDAVLTQKIASHAAHWATSGAAGATGAAASELAAEHVLQATQLSLFAGWATAAACCALGLVTAWLTCFPTATAEQPSPLAPAVAPVVAMQPRPELNEHKQVEGPPWFQPAQPPEEPAPELGEGIGNLLQVLPVDLDNLTFVDAQQRLTTLYNVKIRFSPGAMAAAGDKRITLKVQDRNGIEVLNQLAQITDLQIAVFDGAAVLCVPNEELKAPPTPNVQEQF